MSKAILPPLLENTIDWAVPWNVRVIFCQLQKALLLQWGVEHVVAECQCTIAATGTHGAVGIDHRHGIVRASKSFVNGLLANDGAAAASAASVSRDRHGFMVRLQNVAGQGIAGTVEARSV